MEIDQLRTLHARATDVVVELVDGLERLDAGVLRVPTRAPSGTSPPCSRT